MNCMIISDDDSTCDKVENSQLQNGLNYQSKHKYITTMAHMVDNYVGDVEPLWWN